MNWEYYVSRRKINVADWLIKNGITGPAGFLAKLAELQINPPDDATVQSLWPPVVEKTEEIKSEEESEKNDDHKPPAPEGLSQTPAWSVAGQGEADYQRSAGKQSDKFQGRGDRRGR